MPSSKPTPEIQALIDAAAVRWKVPNTLIMAIGRVETGFEVSYAAASPSTARGMFRATDELRASCESFQREGASEAERQILVMASTLAVLLDSKLWRGNRTGAIMSYYFAKDGAGNYASAIETGSARAASLPGGADSSKWPAAARQYWQAVTSARANFQEQAAAKGGTRIERIKNAFVALQTLNGAEWSGHDFGTPNHKFKLDEWTAAVVEMESWDHDLDFGTANPVTDEHIAEMWEGYAAFFEMAPLTDATTPAPKTLEATLTPKAGILDRVIAPFDKLAKAVMDGLHRVDKQAEDFAHSIEQTGLYIGLGVIGLGVLWVLTRKS